MNPALGWGLWRFAMSGFFYLTPVKLGRKDRYDHTWPHMILQIR